MNADIIFIIIILIIITSYFFDTWLEIINHNYRKNPLPENVKDVYDIEKIKTQESYHNANFKTDQISSAISFILILGVLFAGILPKFDTFLRGYTQDSFWLAALFFGGISLVSMLISLPFSIYSTFVIEEKFGFNKTTTKTFILDIIKSTLLAIVFGGIILYAVIWFLNQTGEWFWVWIWAIIIAFSLFMTMFYSNIIVPLFNKQTPLPDNELRSEIEKFAIKAGFTLKNIYVIDASKRSTKTNAYFTGLGKKKRIVLFDNLIEKHTTSEIVAVLAHEIGHYKHKHSLWNIIISFFQTGIILFILSLFINNPLLSKSLGADNHSFHISIIAFGLLFEPISMVTSFFTTFLSRKFEYQADDYAASFGLADDLALALKNLSKDNLSNINPHPFYVTIHYSHPPLHKRLENLNK